MRITYSYSCAMQMSDTTDCCLTECVVNFLSLTGCGALFEVLFIDYGFVNFVGNLDFEWSGICETPRQGLRFGRYFTTVIRRSVMFPCS